jgi:hypothetical protein
MSDILEPLCEQRGLNYVEGKGNESITQAIAFLRRAEQLGKPAHVIYVSDFDPGGESMPVGIARQIQFWLEEYEIDVDVSVDHAVLTLDQCKLYELPRTPIKDSDKRGPGWEKRYGEGATELDALEAVRPGELAKIILASAKPYRDPKLKSRLAKARDDASDLIRDEWNSAGGSEIEDAAVDLDEQAAAIVAPQAERIRKIIEETEAQLQPLTEQADELEQQAADIEADFDIDLPERPAAKSKGDPDVLYDSRRHWLDQLAAFRDHHTGE